MARLVTVLLATALAGASFASAEAQSLPWGPFAQQPSYDDGRAWRHYPPNYGAETGPALIGAAVGGFFTNPCFLNGCHFYHGDLAYAASWGSVEAAGDSSEAAFRAMARLADKAAVSPVMIEPGSRTAPSRGRHRAHKNQP